MTCNGVPVFSPPPHAWLGQHAEYADARTAALFVEDNAGSSWLGGPSFTPSSLPHVATFALGNLPDNPLLNLLPAAGYLEVFHDGAGTGALTWHKGGRTYPAPNPTDAYQRGTFRAAHSIASPNDRFELPDSAFAAYDLLYSDWQGALIHERGRKGEFNSTLLGGHSSTGAAVALDELLPDKDFALLAEIESWTTLEWWFGDACPLEVWIRPADLAAGDFGRAEVLIRAD